MYKLKILVLVTLSYFISCDNSRQNRWTHIEDNEVKGFLEKMFEKNGGLEKWESLKSLNYRKSYKLYVESGEVEKSVQQIHDYKFLPNMSISITSSEDGDKKEIVFENEQIKEYVNDTLNKQANQVALTNNLQSSLFVISQPFKLVDQGPVLAYEGIKTLNSGEEVHVLRAEYNSTLAENLTTSDTWWVYFDKSTYLMTGYTVKHLDHYSLVRNLETIEVNGFHFPQRRKSWRVNENGDILYLRASYQYSDFEIK